VLAFLPQYAIIDKGEDNMNLRSLTVVGILIGLAIVAGISIPYFLNSMNLPFPYAMKESPDQHKGNDGFPAILIGIAVAVLIVRWRVRVNREAKSLKPQAPPADIAVYGKTWSRSSGRVGHYKYPA